MHELVLASTSPRRRQILEQGGYKFRTSSVKVSEIVKENLNLEGQIEDLALQKAQALVGADKSLEKQGILLLAADTVVVLDGVILGKPKSQTEAEETLALLSGRKHWVITGVCLWQTRPKKVVCFHDKTEVEFKNLSQQEISSYVASGEPMDKAGSYGIQGLAGSFVQAYRGSFHNVVGLPIEKLQSVLQENGWSIDRE